ncbi:hypothetical protein Vafri_15666 [Volvox africanus]|nr:hypothetical protein Vafri_15666 [Volvox africanus]
MKELSDPADLSRLRIKANLGMVRLQAEDYINNRIDLVTDTISEDEGDSEAEGESSSICSAAGTVSAPSSAPNTPRASMTPRRTMPLRRRDSSSIAGTNSAAVNGGAAAATNKKTSRRSTAGNRSGSIGGGDSTATPLMLARRSAGGGSQYVMNQQSSKGGSSEQKLLATGRVRAFGAAAATSSADQGGREGPRRPMPPKGSPPASVNPRTTSIMSTASSAATSRSNTTASRRIDYMMGQLKRLDRTGTISTGRISSSGEAFTGPTPGPNWELHFARASKQKRKSVSCAGSVAEMSALPCLVTPLLTDDFVQNCVSSLVDDAQSATFRSRFSSPGHAGGCKGRRSGGGAGSQSCDGSSPRGRRSQNVKPPSGAENGLRGGASAAMALLNRGCMAWPTPDCTVRVAERWLYGRHVTRDDTDVFSGGGGRLSAGTASLRGRSQGQSAPTSPRRPPALDPGSCGVSPRHGCSIAESVSRSAKNSAISSSIRGTGGGTDCRSAGGTADGSLGDGGKDTSGESASTGGAAQSLQTLAVAVAVAEGRYIPPAENASCRSAPVTPRAYFDSSRGEGGGCGEGLGGGAANFAPVVGVSSRPDSPAATALLFHSVTGSVPLTLDGETVRPICTLQELEKLRSFRIQKGTSPRVLRNAKSGLVRRSSSSSNLEILSPRFALITPNKLPKLGVAFTEADSSAAAVAEAQPLSGGCRTGGGDEAACQATLHTPLSRKAMSPGVGRCSSPGEGLGTMEADDEPSSACRSAPQSPRGGRRRAGEGGNGLASKMRTLFDILSR